MIAAHAANANYSKTNGFQIIFLREMGSLREFTKLNPLKTGFERNFWE